MAPVHDRNVAGAILDCGRTLPAFAWCAQRLAGELRAVQSALGALLGQLKFLKKSDTTLSVRAATMSACG